MEGELIYVSIVSGLFGIFGLLLLNRNWFKKQIFKSDMELLRAKNKLELEKIRRELGITQTTKKQEFIQTKIGETDILGSLGALAPFLRNLDGEQIADLIERFTGSGQGENESMGSLADTIKDFIVDNPDVVKAFTGGLKDGKATQTEPRAQV